MCESIINRSRHKHLSIDTPKNVMGEQDNIWRWKQENLSDEYNSYNIK